MRAGFSRENAILSVSMFSAPWFATPYLELTTSAALIMV